VKHWWSGVPVGGEMRKFKRAEESAKRGEEI